MTPCARGCCFTGLQICHKNRECACHADERRPARNSPQRHRDPTADKAIRNVMKENRK